MSDGQGSAEAAFSLFLWFSFNILTLILNKWLFTVWDFTYPLILTAFHMLFCTVGSVLVLRVFKLVPRTTVEQSDYYTKIVPLAFVFCLNIILGNYAIRFIAVSFAQTVKASVPFFTVLLEVLVLRKRFGGAVLASLVPVVGGVALATWHEVNFAWNGFLCALIASVTTATQSIVSSLLLSSKYKFDSVNLTYYLSPVSFAILIPLAWAFEWDDVYARLDDFTNPDFLALLCTSSSVAFLLNLSVFYALRTNSAVTFTVAGNAKVVLVIVISVLVFKNEISFLNGVGCVIAICGVVWYNHAKDMLAARSAKGKEKEQTPPSVLVSSFSSLQSGSASSSSSLASGTRTRNDV